MTRLLKLLLLTTLVAGPALAKKDTKVDVSTPAARAKASKDFAILANHSLTKKGGVPTKIAILGFQVRYEFNTQEFGYSGSTYSLKMTDDAYTQVTDNLYDDFVQLMEGNGYEILPKDELVASEVYQKKMKNKDEGKDKESKKLDDKSEINKFLWGSGKGGVRAVFAPSGMKNMGKLFGAMAKVQMAGGALADDLGVDAVLLVYTNFQMCAMTKKAGGGTKICYRGPDDRYDIGGAYIPSLQVTGTVFRENKQGVMAGMGSFGWGKQGGSPIWADGESVVFDADKSILRRDMQGDGQAFVDGVGTIFQLSNTIGIEQLEDQTAKLRSKL